jgi:hypothetical protein
MANEDLLHLLQTDPDAANRLIERQLQKQYGEALTALHTLMQNRDRTRKEVSEALSTLHTNGRPAPVHIPALMALERVTRETGGTAYSHVEKAIFEEMGRLHHPDLIPFLAEAFVYGRSHDPFARSRRIYAAYIMAEIAGETDDPQAFAALNEMLNAPKADLRQIALGVVHDVFVADGGTIPPALADVIGRLATGDPDDGVRQIAEACTAV